jgi:TetR/AcrR family transcriptional regulator, regulator of cefoperazone and chloramphenicol sensitivity
MDDTHHQLMDAAGPLFAEKGFRSTTVREICDAAKANQAAINYHFGDKENLYIECVRHAANSCMTRVPMPTWPEGTPAKERLRDFIRMFLNRVAVDHMPIWQGQLIMREMLIPTKACAEFVKDYVRPTFGALRDILSQLLPPNVTDHQKMLIGFSIVGQALHYRAARSVVTLLVGPETFQSLDVETLTEHITAFSLAAIERIAQQAATETPS